MPPLNAAPFSKNVNPTIYNVFPELNQGKQYLQKQTEVKKKINKTHNFIESFTPYNTRGQLKKCRAVGQASPNKHVPCACGNAMCTTSMPYCNYQLGACFPAPANQNQAIEDWDVNSNCAGDGQFSSCKAKAGCASYGYCPPQIDNTLQWQKDRARAYDPNGGDLKLNSLVSQQIMRKADYMSNVQEYVLMPPPCNGDLANCPANPPYYGRNVTIPQQSGVAPYGPGYPHPSCGLEVLGNPGDGGKAAVSRTQVESLDATCHAEPDCVGFGKKSGGGWDFLTWNANPTYSGPKDPRMKTPGDYPKYFYIQNPVTGCNSSKCCGIQGTPGNCKTDPYDPACYVPGGAPPVPNTPSPTSAPPPPSIAGGWSNWSTSCPPAPNNIQTRTCTRPPPAYDGPDCSALDGGNAYRACNPPVNGGWSDWTTGCPPAPGNQQTRSCTAPPTAYGGTPCSGPSSRPCFSPSTFTPTPPTCTPKPRVMFSGNWIGTSSGREATWNADTAWPYGGPDQIWTALGNYGGTITGPSSGKGGSVMMRVGTNAMTSSGGYTPPEPPTGNINSILIDKNTTLTLTRPASPNYPAFTLTRTGPLLIWFGWVWWAGSAFWGAVGGGTNDTPVSPGGPNDIWVKMGGTHGPPGTGTGSGTWNGYMDPMYTSKLPVGCKFELLPYTPTSPGAAPTYSWKISCAAAPPPPPSTPPTAPCPAGSCCPVTVGGHTYNVCPWRSGSTATQPEPHCCTTGMTYGGGCAPLTAGQGGCACLGQGAITAGLFCPGSNTMGGQTDNVYDGTLASFTNRCCTQTCLNGSKDTPNNGPFSNLGETDVDCGGPTCPPCATGKNCLANSDCISGNCVGWQEIPSIILGTCQ